MSVPPGRVPPDQLIALALGGLPPQEEAGVRATVEADPALYAQWQALLETLAPLLDTLDLSVPPPADAPERLLRRVAASASGAEPPALWKAGRPGQATASAAPAGAPARPEGLTPPPPRASAPPARTRPRPWGPLAAAALALLLVLWSWGPWRTPANLLARYAGQPGAVSRTVSVDGEVLVTLVRLRDARVFVQARRSPAQGRVYQLWRVPERGAPVSLGVLQGQALLTDPLPPATTLALSVEPPGGSPQPTAEPLFAERL